MNAKSFTIAGLIIPVIETVPCLRVHQYMKREPITCSCDRCARDNAGMSEQQIRARMDKAHGVAA